MEADDILIQAKTNDEAPHGWIVLRLSRSKVATGIAGWIFGILVGLGLFTGMALITIPYNYQQGTFAAIFTTVLLGIFLFIGLGSLWALIVDIRRLRQAHNHIIVITPQDFVKQEGAKITHVPLVYVRHVTTRGRAPVDRTPPKSNTIREMPSVGENVSGFIFGRGAVPSGLRRKRMRTPTSLAFIDSRTENEVTVVTDEAHGDPYMIAALLKQYAANVQNIA